MIARVQVPLLWLLLGLFVLRVLGQVYVGLYAPPVLPPWEEWYSGLLPYPWLLSIQILLLMWMAVINVDSTRKNGRFYVKSHRVKRWLRIISTVYFLAMALRYVVVMALVPEMRWLHGTIPIFFHFVLAGYIYTLTRDSRDAPIAG